MKVIGLIEYDVYICQVSHTEIEKFLNLYYNKKDKLKVGDTVDMGAGYDFLRNAKDALSTTEDFIKANKKVIEMIVAGISLMSRGDDVPEVEK